MKKASVKNVKTFEKYLKDEEKSAATVEKYLRMSVLFYIS